MPNRSATSASGFINPSEGLSFSGAAVVFQQQTTALKQTSDIAAFHAPSATTNTPQTTDFSHAGLASASEQGGTAFSAGLLAPLQSPVGVTSSSSAENAVPQENNPENGDDEDDDREDSTSTTTASPDGCDTSVSDLYCVYTVQEGDLLSSIADRFGLTSTENFVNWELLVRSNNSVVVDADDVAPGLKMIIPRGNGVIHTVLSNETLTEVAEQYGVTVEEIMAVPGNGISNADDVSIGKEILIPNPVQFAPTFVPDETVERDDEDDSDSSEDRSDDSSEESDDDSSDDSSSDDSSDSSSGSITGGGATSSSGFAWPISGPISSYYGPNHPLGIDIDLFGRAGAPISAAMGGVVTFAGGNACCSYGYYVVVDHGNGYQTLYAHLSSVGVSMGEVVAQGQYLGGAGTTGYSTGVHLHFEVQSGGSRVNPMNLLP